MTQFRGATNALNEIEFDTSKPMVMIFGENGSGKSTIIDALDLVCNKSLGSLAGRSSTTAKHLAAIGHDVGEVKVEVTLGTSVWTGRYSKRVIEVSGPGPVPRLCVLRRNSLLRLVEAEPSKRYDELKGLIDVSSIEKSEQALRKEQQIANEEVDRLTETKVVADEDLRNLWRAEGSPGAPSKSEVDWAKDKSAADISKLSLRLVSISELLTHLDEADRAKLNCENDETAFRNRSGELDRIKRQIEDAERRDSKISSALMDILKKVETLVAPTDAPNECPVCLQPFDANELRRSIKRRLAEMKSLAALNERRETAARQEGSARTIMDNGHANLLKAARKLSDCIGKSQEGDIREYVGGKSGKTATQPFSTTSTQPSVTDAKTLVDGLMMLRLKLVADKDQSQADLNKFNGIKQAYERSQQAVVNLTTADALQTNLKKALEVVHGARIKFVQKVLDDVADECQKLYSQVHPGESLELKALRLDEKTKGSIHQEAVFEGFEDVPPQAYFSDSHLDTLGLCFWLAVVKSSTNGNAVVILDDVLTSIDAPHLQNVVDLLIVEADLFNQVIATTHSRTWLDWYRFGRVASNKTHIIELARWKRAQGILSVKAEPAVDELNRLLAMAKLDRQGVSSKAGVLLEQAFDYLTKRYKCAVPRSLIDAYELADLCNGAAKLAKVLKIRRPILDSDGKEKSPPEMEQISLKALYDKISNGTFIRNQVGAHFNPDGAGISDADIEAFGKRAAEFVSSLICPLCRAIPRREKGTHFECGCGKTRMEPLKI
jgi:energy-coupling factor transporter ATP-binding protein EcfA2